MCIQLCAANQLETACAAFNITTVHVATRCSDP